MTAVEARTLSDAATNPDSPQVKPTLDAIYNRIKEIALRGGWGLEFEASKISNDQEMVRLVCKLLEDQGFKVERFYGDQREPENKVIVRW